MTLKNLLSASLAKKLLTAALARGGDFAEIYYERSLIHSLFLDENRLKRLPYGNLQGIGIRVLCGDSTGYAYSEDLETRSLLRTASIAAEIAAGKGGSAAFSPLIRLKKYREDVDIVPSDVTLEEKCRWMWEANRIARNYSPWVREVKVGYRDVEKLFCVTNSEGLRVENFYVFTSLFVRVFSVRKNKKHEAFASAGGVCGTELFDAIPIREIARRAADTSIRFLDARDAPAGSMPVVIGPGRGSVLFHEAIGHSFEADTVLKGRSAIGKFRGKRVAGKYLTVVDDPLVPKMGGSLIIDDEGTPGRKTFMIENGIVRDFLHDRLSAKMAKSAPTGNGRRESFRHIPIPRMTNTCVMPGKYEPEEIIEATKSGIYVKSIGGGQVNTASGDFTFDTPEAYLIENGKITAPLRKTSLVGNTLEVLKNIDMIGNDYQFARDGGRCGKGQWVHVDSAQPTLRVSRMTVAGTR